MPNVLVVHAHRVKGNIISRVARGDFFYSYGEIVFDDRMSNTGKKIKTNPPPIKTAYMPL